MKLTALHAALTLSTAAQPPIILDPWCATNHQPIHRDGVHDDSPCVAAAVAYAEAHNAELEIPAGGPILMAGAAQVALDNITLFAHDYQDRGSAAVPTPSRQGAVFWITDTQKPAFVLGRNAVAILGLDFYWPDQHNSRATPIAYPPLLSPEFPGQTTQSFRFIDNTVINAYDFLDYAHAAIGNVNIAGSAVWAIDDALRLSTVPEVFLVDDSLFSLGVGSAQNTPLADWYSLHGTWAVISGVAALQSVNTYIYGARYGIHITSSGDLSLGHAIGGGFDTVPTILLVDPGGEIGAFNFTSQYWNARFYHNATTTPLPTAAVEIPRAATTNTQQIIFTGLYFNADGSAFDISGITGLGPIISNSDVSVCIDVKTGSCGFVTGNGNFIVSNNQVVNHSSTVRATGVTTTGTASITGNTFYNMGSSVVINTARAPVVVTGNLSLNTRGAHDVAGTYGKNAVVEGNGWSKP